MAKAMSDVYGLDMNEHHSRLMRKVWMSHHNHERQRSDHREHDRPKGQQQRPDDSKPAASPPTDKKPATIMNKFKYDSLLKMGLAFAIMAAAGWFGWPVIKDAINSAARPQALTYGFASDREVPMLRDLVHRPAGRWRICNHPPPHNHCGPWHDDPPPEDQR